MNLTQPLMIFGILILSNVPTAMAGNQWTCYARDTIGTPYPGSSTIRTEANALALAKCRRDAPPAYNQCIQFSGGECQAPSSPTTWSCTVRNGVGSRYEASSEDRGEAAALARAKCERESSSFFACVPGAECVSSDGTVTGPTTPLPPYPPTPTPPIYPGPGENPQNVCVFNEGAYLAMYPDVSAAVFNQQYSSGWDHYSRFGRREGRSPNYDCPGGMDVTPGVPVGPTNPTDCSYNEAAYLAMYPDVSAAVFHRQYNSGWDHYTRHGRYEGRAPNYGCPGIR